MNRDESQSETRLTASKLSKITGKTARWINKRAKKEGWKFKWIKGLGGEHKEYLFHNLPPDIQIRYYNKVFQLRGYLSDLRKIQAKIDLLTTEIELDLLSMGTEYTRRIIRKTKRRLTIHEIVELVIGPESLKTKERWAVEATKIRRRFDREEVYFVEKTGRARGGKIRCYPIESLPSDIQAIYYNMEP